MKWVKIDDKIFSSKDVYSRQDNYSQYAEWDLNKTSKTITGTLTGLFLMA